MQVHQIAAGAATSTPKSGRARALAGLVALSAALGGCMTSHRPLFPEGSAVAALGEGGRYVAYQKVGAHYRRDETVELRRRERGYDYVNEKGAITPLTLHPLGGGLFAVQARDGGGDYVYARLRLTGVAGFVAVADCGRQDKRALAALGVVAQASALPGRSAGRGPPPRDCDLDGVRDARKVFSTLDFGAPTGKLVRQ